MRGTPWTSYLDIPNNYYIPDGMNSRLLQITDRKEFDRKTIGSNEGFVLEIPFLEGAFSTKYFIVDKTNGHMMGIYDDKVGAVECKAQMEPFNLDQLNIVVATLKQRRQGFDISFCCRHTGKCHSREINQQEGPDNAVPKYT